MQPVSRYARIVAKPGQEQKLLERMLAVSDSLREFPGCLLYIINQVPGEPGTLWVTELWRSQEDIDGALDSEGAKAAMPGVLELVDRERGERIDLAPVGGVGYRPQEKGFALVHLPELEDSAARFGYGEYGEARFARGALDAQNTGLSLQSFRPGVRQAFGHTHQLDEEIYVVLEGGGLMAIDEETIAVRTLDAVRVAPGSARAFEAGPDGLTVLAVGTHHAGDAQVLPGFWAG